MAAPMPQLEILGEELDVHQPASSLLDIELRCVLFAEFLLQADTELLEFICEENEKDSALLAGK